MDGMLSQDEINALLSGMDLSQDLDDSMENEDVSGEFQSDFATDENTLTDVEKDAIGEVANISMGSSATTLYSLVNRKVNITTPVVTMAEWEALLSEYERPCVFIQIKYTQGLDGSNILVLKEQDVKIITDLMMGGDGTNIDGELGELHLSAISEAMNQMMGSAATSLSTMLKQTIDISPPESSLVDLTQYKSGGEVANFLGGSFVKISFRMQIADLVDSTIMQLYPVGFAKELVETFFNTQMGMNIPDQEMPALVQETVQESAAAVAEMPSSGQTDMNSVGTNAAPAETADMSAMGANPMGMNPMMNGMGMNPMMGTMGVNPMGMNPMMNSMGMNPMMGMSPMMNGMGMNPMTGMPQADMQNVNVQPAQFQNFTPDVANIGGQENIGLIKDVPLEVTVELGRTSKSISEILNFAPGTIIELERIAGEPIDVLVNGKYVAKGEVVVIEESFGVRVTEIIK